MAAIENGFQQREIQQAAYTCQQAVESRDEIVVGVNRFEVDGEESIDMLRIDRRTREAKQVRQAEEAQGIARQRRREAGA